MSPLRFTPLWFLFGPVLGCMWLAAVNYENNLVYAVLYLVAALSFVSVFHTWRNLAAVEVEHVRVKPSFAGEEIEVEIHLRNRGVRPSYNLSFERLDRGKRKPIRSRKGTNLEAGDAQVVIAFLPPAARGRYFLEKLIVRSAYPFGLFWAQLRAPAQAIYYVYPAAHGRDELPAMQNAGVEGPRQRSGDDFSGVRAYSPGESLRHIDWKAFARGRPLVVKQFTGGEGQELWLEAHALLRMSLEDRLSQMTLWALEAEEMEIPYGLNVGDVHLAPGLGSNHRRQILEALATAGRVASAE
jgi:uncharacterized protein (DUF58 family)